MGILFILKRIWWFCRDNWKIVVPAVVLLVLVVFIYKACSKPAKLNEKEIQAGQQAIEQHNDERLKEVLASADAREQGIDANVARSEANTKAAVEEAKKKYDEMDRDALQAEFDRRAKE
jgi:hypothetical protein